METWFPTLLQPNHALLLLLPLAKSFGHVFLLQLDEISSLLSKPKHMLQFAVSAGLSLISSNTLAIAFRHRAPGTLEPGHNPAHPCHL